jgi:hypothetical protein
VDHHSSGCPALRGVRRVGMDREDGPAPGHCLVICSQQKGGVQRPGIFHLLSSRAQQRDPLADHSCAVEGPAFFPCVCQSWVRWPPLVDAPHNFLGPPDRIRYRRYRRGNSDASIVLSQLARRQNGSRDNQHSLSPLIHLYEPSRILLLFAV